MNSCALMTMLSVCIGICNKNVFLSFRLVTGGVPVNHFSHVFVDEAGQALEPETVIAIAGYFVF